MFNFEKPQFTPVNSNMEKKAPVMDMKEYMKNTLTKPVAEKLRRLSVILLSTLSTVPGNAQEMQHMLSDIHKNNTELYSIGNVEVPDHVVDGMEYQPGSQFENIFFVSSEGAQLKIEETQQMIDLDVGVKVVHLGFDEDGKRKIFTWNQGEYVSGVLETGEVSEHIPAEFESQAFVLDGIHTISRAENKIFYNTEGCLVEMYNEYGDQGPASITREQLQSQIDHQISENAEFITFIDSVKNSFAGMLQEGEIFSSKHLQAMQNKHMQFYENPYFSKGDKLQYTVDNIFNVYDPAYKNTELKFSEAVAVLPLSQEYLTSNLWLRQNVEQYDDLLHLFIGGSGEVVDMEDDRFSEIVREIEFLKQHIDQLPVGFEKKWLETLEVESLSQKQAFIAVSDAVYDMTPRQHFAEAVAVGRGFANISIHPLQSVLIHEINMSGDFFPDDSHIPVDEVLESREDLTEKRLECATMSPENIDNVYQSDSYVDILNFAYILKTIQEVR